MTKPAAPRPVDSRLRGNDGEVGLICLVFTLTFDSSPIKGEGDSVGWICLITAFHHCPSGLRIKSAMT